MISNEMGHLMFSGRDSDGLLDRAELTHTRSIRIKTFIFDNKKNNFFERQVDIWWSAYV